MNPISVAVQRAVAGRDLLGELAQGMATALDSPCVWLFVLSELDGYLRSAAMASALADDSVRRAEAAARNGLNEVRVAITDGENPLAAVLLRRQPRFNWPLDDFRRASGAAPLVRALGLLPVQSISLLPLVSSAKSLGVLVIGAGLGSSHDEQVQGLLNLLANQAALAIEHQRLLAQLRTREAETKAAQAFRQMLLDTMGDGLAVLDASGRIEFVNRRLCRMTGYGEADLIGRDFLTLTHPDDQDAVQKQLAFERRTQTGSFEKQLVRKDGSVAPVLVVRVPWPPGSNGQGGSVIVVSDLSEQKLREVELQRRNRELGAMNKAVRAITSTLDQHEIVQTILEEAVEAVGAEGGAILLLDEQGDLVFDAAVGPSSTLGLRVPRGSGIAGWVVEHGWPALVGAAGQDKRFYMGIDAKTGMSTKSILAAPLMVKGQVFGVVELINKLDGQFNDDDLRLIEGLTQASAVAIENARLYTELNERAKQLEVAYGELHEVDKLRQELVGNVSHELRSPLTFISGYVNLLLEGQWGELNPEQQQGLQIIAQKADTLAQLVTGIVNLQRMDAPPAPTDQFDLAEMARLAVRTWDVTTRDTDITLESEIPETPVMALGDRERIYQVFDNLLSNAIKFTPDGGRVTVRVLEMGQRVRVEVSDTGVGIPANQLEKVFERFYQIDHGAPARGVRGVGLGLSISKGIIAAHGGEITVESEEGQGSTFAFTLKKAPSGQ
jgi:PAS domain S-box-containing protein